jgi:hypothetical protein
MTEQNIASSGLAIAQAQATDRTYSIPYRPQYTAIAGSVTAALLLQQITYWWYKSKRRPFYKFKEACDHGSYRAGDSWCEELGFTRAMFDGALKKLAVKIKTGMKKSDELSRNIVIYWTDSSHRTWYQVNEILLGAYTYLAYNDPETLAKVEKSLYLDKEEKLLYLDKAGKSLYLYSETTSSETTSSDIPPAGENLAQEIFGDPPPPEQQPTKEERLQALRNVAGVDVGEGVIKAHEHVKPDEWQATADVFCMCVHGLRLPDMTESDQKNWPTRLKTIAEGIGASSTQMIAALRVMPEKESGFAWKIPGAYSSPYVKAFEADIKIVIAKLAAGQLLPRGEQQKGWSKSL